MRCGTVLRRAAPHGAARYRTHHAAVCRRMPHTIQRHAAQVDKLLQDARQRAAPQRTAPHRNESGVNGP